MLKLKDIFTLDLNTRGGVKLFNKIANKYNLHKEDRKDLMNVEVGSSEDNKGFQYKSKKVCWEFKTEQILENINNNTISNEVVIVILQVISLYLPLYSAINHLFDSAANSDIKYYHYIANALVANHIIAFSNNVSEIYIEEAQSDLIFNDGSAQIDTSGGLISVLHSIAMPVTETDLYEIGIIKITYEEYINKHLDYEMGKELVNE